MRLITIMLALLLASSGASAQWTYVAEGKNTIFAMDLTTIRKDGDRRKVWELLNYEEPQDGALSALFRYEYDCKDERYRTLHIVTYPELWGKGNALLNHSRTFEWQNIPPQSIASKSLKIVCAK